MSVKVVQERLDSCNCRSSLEEEQVLREMGLLVEPPKTPKEAQR